MVISPNSPPRQLPLAKVPWCLALSECLRQAAAAMINWLRVPGSLLCQHQIPHLEERVKVQRETRATCTSMDGWCSGDWAPINLTSCSAHLLRTPVSSGKGFLGAERVGLPWELGRTGESELSCDARITTVSGMTETWH